jgi:hypothetical protein
VAPWTRRLAALGLSALLLLAAAPALGGEDDTRITRRGECSSESVWALTVRSVDTERLRVRLVIAGGPEGDEWNVFMDHNGVGFFSGSRVAGAEGLVLVRRLVEDLDGSDRIRAGALDLATGETCRARATLS